MEAGDLARAGIARRRVKRAAGLLREVTRDLSALSGDADTLGVVHVDSDADVHGLHALVTGARAKHPEGVDVVILARPADAG